MKTLNTKGESFKKTKKYAKSIQNKLLSLFQESDFTAQELATFTELKLCSVTARIRELRNLGHIMIVKTQLDTETNRHVNVYGIQTIEAEPFLEVKQKTRKQLEEQNQQLKDKLALVGELLKHIESQNIELNKLVESFKGDK